MVGMARTNTFSSWEGILQWAVVERQGSLRQWVVVGRVVEHRGSLRQWAVAGRAVGRRDNLQSSLRGILQWVVAERRGIHR